MRSRYADKFNHDDVAFQYDEDVADEGNPIRAGYSALLDWVVAEAAVDAGSRVLELGTGTGNLTLQVARARRLVCVDVSAEMLGVARDKLQAIADVEYLQADLLECFDSLSERFDTLVSTYAIHHLTDSEKLLLFRAMAETLEPGGVAVIGDLMFADEEHRRRYLTRLRASNRVELAEEIEDEFFWNLASAVAELEGLGFQVTTERFSELSWGLAARKAARSLPRVP